MADEKKTANGMKPWIRVLLVLSLALNLLVIGMVGGAMVNWSKWRGHHHSRLDMAGGPLTRALSQDDRRAIGKQMRQAYRSGDMPHADLRAELEGLVRDLKTVPFDRAAVERRLARHRGAFEDRLAFGQTLLLERLSVMNDEERVAYADRLQEALSRRDWRHRRDNGSE